MELLAPAGNMEKMKMALLYGADAVYMAGKAFGLRAYGGNFTREEMKEAVEYAHSMGKKVYITVNIIPRNEDLEGLDTYLKYFTRIFHADAVLDFPISAYFDIAREAAPDLPVHVRHAGERGKLAHRQEMERYGRVPRRSCQRSIPFQKWRISENGWISNWKYSAMGRSVFPGAAAVFYPIILQTGNASPTGVNASRPAGLNIP